MKSIQQENTFSAFEKIVPWIGSILLLPIVAYFTFNIGKQTIIDIVDLLIHEGGHGIFRFFGKFIHALGGTLMQIIIPGMFVVFYLFKKNRVGAQVFLVWMGQNLLNISVYASDAQAQQLPLLGGKKVFHDWNYLLRALGLLEYDYLVGQTFVILGISSFLVALAIPLIIREQKKINLELDI